MRVQSGNINDLSEMLEKIFGQKDTKLIAEGDGVLTPEQEAACRDTEMEALSPQERGHIYAHMSDHGKLAVAMASGRFEAKCDKSADPDAILSDGVFLTLDNTTYVFRKHAALRLMFGLGKSITNLERVIAEREAAAQHPAVARAEEELSNG